MLINAKSSPWIAICLAVGAVAVGVYVMDAPRHLSGPSGSTAVGITLGVVAYGIMLFCAALSLKRKVPHWRLGSAQAWLRGHVWLGLLMALLVALHAAFSWGEGLSPWLWILTGVVSASGVLGVMLQQFAPRILLHSVRGESVAQQLPRALADCAAQAQAVVVAYSGSVDKPSPPMTWPGLDPLVGKIATPSPAPPTTAKSVATATAAAPAKTCAPPVGGEPLRRFYLEIAKPFFDGAKDSPLAHPTDEGSLLTALRTVTPVHIHPGIDELHELCERRRDLLAQRRWMRLLHGWLIVHVPLSWVFIVLVPIHAIWALRYM